MTTEKLIQEAISAMQVSGIAVQEAMADAFILDSWNGQMGWRWMFWAEALPAALRKAEERTF